MASAKRSFGWVRDTVRRKAQVRWPGSARVVGWACHNQKLRIWRGLPLAPSHLQFLTATNARDQRGRIMYYNKGQRMRPRTSFLSTMVSDCTSASKIFSRPTSRHAVTPVDLCRPLPSSSPWSPRPPLFLNHPELIPGSGIPYLSLLSGTSPKTIHSIWFCIMWITHDASV